MRARLAFDEAMFSRVEVGLRNIATKVPDNARKTMRRAAERIVKKAKMYVPEDTAALMESIRMEVAYGARGRLEIRVVVGGQGVVNIGGVLIDIDQYAAIVHEHYEDMLVYGPGERTLEKMAMYGSQNVGSGFLTRAHDEERAVLERDLVKETKSIIKIEGLE